MTRDEALEAVAKIASLVDDDEVAHSMEDNLRGAFIEYAAELPGELGEIAKIVLSTDALNFCRWYA